MFPLNHKGSACKTNHIGVTCGQSGELRPGGRPPGEGCGERLGCRPLLSPAHFPEGLFDLGGFPWLAVLAAPTGIAGAS